jgi:hypothetical protein
VFQTHPSLSRLDVRPSDCEAGEPADGGVTLNQTELNIMTALGWNTQIPQAVFTATPSGDWADTLNFSTTFRRE